MLIDTTYFLGGELDIANADTVPVQENLNRAITKYEPNFLRMILGPAMYANYQAGILLDPIPQEWLDLQDQLRNDTTKVSPIANYIYFYVVRGNVLYNSGTGVSQTLGENSTRGDSKILTTNAWNEMKQLSFEVYKFLLKNVAIYGPTGYTLYFRNDWWLWDWYYWWSWLPYAYRECVPEIYQSINVLNF